MTTSLDQIAEALGALRMDLEPDEEQLALAVYRSLATGEPQSDAAIADRVGQATDWVTDRLKQWPGVFRDAEGRVVGFWGLAIGEMDHRFEVDGRMLYTWCAWDPLFIAPLLQTEAQVTSRCPVTNETITLKVGPDGISDLSHADAVMSILEPSDPEDIVTEFCHFVLFFANQQAGEAWRKDHPHTHLVTVDEGFELGRRTRLFGEEAA